MIDLNSGCAGSKRNARPHLVGITARERRDPRSTIDSR